MRFVPESKAPHARRIDPIGQLAVATFLAALTYAIIEAPRAGWLSAQTVGLVALSFVALVLVVGYERRRPEPLLDLRFFRSIPFSAATLTGSRHVRRVSPACCCSPPSTCRTCAGCPALSTPASCLLPMAVLHHGGQPVIRPAGGDEGASTSPVGAGAGICIGAAMLLPGLGRHTSLVWLEAGLVVFAAGFGLVNAPITFAAVSGMPRSQAGVAAAIASTSRQVGAAFGVAVVGSVLNDGLHGRAMAAGFVSASRPAWLIVSGCGLAVFALALLSTGRRARVTAERAATLFDDNAPSGPPEHTPAGDRAA